MKLFKSLVLSAFSMCVLASATISNAGTIDSAAKAAELEKIKLLTAQITLEPKQALLYAKRGQCYVHLKDWNSALTDTNAAIDLDATVGRFYSARGSIYNVMGKHDLEKLDLEHAVRLSPNDVQCLKKLAIWYGVNDKYAASCDLLSKAISIQPNFADLYLLRAEALTSLGQFQGAMVDCDQAEKLEPENKQVVAVRKEINRVQDYKPVQK
jgi:tetratricopeptide (TPR) repeat protein